jgi:molybdate transport system substrate-binding protein
MIVRYTLVGLVAIGVCLASRAEDISVAAAISLKESLEAIRQTYESTTGDHLNFTFASSGQLASQIQNGAPIDLFLSAARKQVDDLKKAGKGDDATACVFVSNELVLIVPIRGRVEIKSFDELGDARVQKLAIGDPKVVPAGQYAQELLDHLKLTEKLKVRIIYGLNVRQVLQYVQGAEVDAGIVYRSDAKLADKQVQVVATSDPGWHQPIEYWGVVVADSKHAAAAKKFLDYLQTDQAQAIFNTHGFVKPTTAPAK